MKKILATILLALSISHLSNAANIFLLSADNDYALYTGDASGTSLTEIFQNDTSWTVVNSYTGLMPATGYLYAVGMNQGGPGGFSGGLNGVNIVNTDWEYVDINTSGLTGYPTTLTETYDLIQSEVEAAITSVTWLDASTIIRPPSTATVGVIDETGAVNTAATHYIIPDEFSARVFRIGIADIPNVATVPEPSSALLLGAASFALLTPQKKTPVGKLELL